jgi:tetratricopeptide (TPR) repeat protein
VCGAPFDRLDNRCGYCGVLVVIKSDHHRIDPSQLNRSVVNEHIQQYRQALRKDQNDEVARYGLGVAYFNMGLREEAVTELTEAARLMPENPFLQAQLGVVLSEIGREGRPDYTFRAKERCDRALMLDPTNGDALTLRQDLIKQDLYNPNTTPEGREALERQLVDTWQRIASADPERARPLLVAFLRKNTDVLTSLPKWSAKSAPRVKAKAGSTSIRRIGESLIWAFAAFLAAIICSIVFSALAPEEADGTINVGSFFGILFAISVLGWFVAPIAVFIVTYRRAGHSEKTPVEDVPQQTQSSYVELFQPTAPIAELLEATEAVARSGWEQAALKRMYR